MELERKTAIQIDEVPSTETASRILQDVVPDVLEHFIRRNRGYGEGAANLGIPGQFADINRKYIKLRKMMWDASREPDSPTEESLETVLIEMIGHCLLSIDMVRGEKGSPVRGSSEGMGF